MDQNGQTVKRQYLLSKDKPKNKLKYFDDFFILDYLDSRISDSLDSIVFGYKIAISINGVNFWRHDVGRNSGVFRESTLGID